MNGARIPWWPAAMWAVLLAGLLGFGAQTVWSLHRSAEARLATVEPRHARLAGLGGDRKRLQDAASQATREVGRHVYPVGKDPSQAGNDAQQRVRDAFAKGGLEVVSIQVLPARAGSRFDRIPITLRVDGEYTALQATLAALPALAPSVFVEGFSVTGAQGIAAEGAPLRVVAEVQLYVMRARP